MDLRVPIDDMLLDMGNCQCHPYDGERGSLMARRGVLKAPLCPNCTSYRHVVLQDASQRTGCQRGFDIGPDSLAVECTLFHDKLKDRYWEEFEHATSEIPIIGQNKTAKVGFGEKK